VNLRNCTIEEIAEDEGGETVLSEVSYDNVTEKCSFLERMVTLKRFQGLNSTLYAHSSLEHEGYFGDALEQLSLRNCRFTWGDSRDPASQIKLCLLAQML